MNLDGFSPNTTVTQVIISWKYVISASMSSQYSSPEGSTYDLHVSDHLKVQGVTELYIKLNHLFNPWQ